MDEAYFKCLNFCGVKFSREQNFANQFSKFRKKIAKSTKFCSQGKIIRKYNSCGIKKKLSSAKILYVIIELEKNQHEKYKQI